MHLNQILSWTFQFFNVFIWLIWIAELLFLLWTLNRVIRLDIKILMLILKDLLLLIILILHILLIIYKLLIVFFFRIIMIIINVIHVILWNDFRMKLICLVRIIETQVTQLAWILAAIQKHTHMQLMIKVIPLVSNISIHKFSLILK